MARIYHTKKARKARGSCDYPGCGKPIEPGQGYYEVNLRPGGPYSSLTKRRHDSHPTWRQSEITYSKMQGIYAAQEQMDDSVGDLESLEDAEALRDDLAEQIRAVAEEYRESATNMEEGFGHATYMSEELSEKADELDSWADTIESIDIPELEDSSECDECQGTGQIDCSACNGSGKDLDSLEDEDCEECEGSGEEECTTCDGTGEAEEADLDDWREEVREALDEINNCPI